jgi:phosphonatase-like hydrolase
MAIRLIIFDMAGTTVQDDDGVNRCLRQSLEEFAAKVSVEAVNAVMGLPKREAIRRLVASSSRADYLLPRLDEIHELFVVRMRCFYETDASIREVAGTSDVFSRLHEARIVTAVNTGFGREIAQIIIDRLGWERNGLLDASVTSDEVRRGRPYPDMIHHLMARFNITDPIEVAKVGDTPIDLEEGRRAGCGLVVGVTQGTHTREQLLPHPHTHLIGSVAELPSLLAL